MSSEINKIEECVLINVLYIGERGVLPLDSFDRNRIEFIESTNFEFDLQSLEYDADLDLVLILESSLKGNDGHWKIIKIRDINKDIPVVVIAEDDSRDQMMDWMRKGSKWVLGQGEFNDPSELVKTIHKNILKEEEWKQIFDHTNDNKNQRIFPGLKYKSLQDLEERFIMKRLFPYARNIDVFPLESALEPGKSGAKVYRVQADDESMRIVKIEKLSNVFSIDKKFERLIRPRINQYIGRLVPPIARAKNLGGASYTLAGSHNQQVISIGTFLRNRNLVTKKSVHEILEQLYEFLSLLYKGSDNNTPVRFWAEYYTKMLPPELEIQDAEFLTIEDSKEIDQSVIHMEDLPIDVISTTQLINRGAMYHHLQNLRDNLKKQSINEFTLIQFEISEIDLVNGIIELQDDWSSRHELSPSQIIPSKELLFMRFKVRVDKKYRFFLDDPTIRKGKKISVRGKINYSSLRHNIIRRAIEKAMPELYDRQPAPHGNNKRFEEGIVELYGAWFMDPMKCLDLLMWEVGEEDFVRPRPTFSPVVHGDLNFKNILLATIDESPRVWLIDFADAHYNHIYVDIVKVEIEFRAHVLSKIFAEMHQDNKFSRRQAIKMGLLIEDLLYEKFEHPEELHEQISKNYGNVIRELNKGVGSTLYWENLLYFLVKIRMVARQLGTVEQFSAHYPIALFFRSMAHLKYSEVQDTPWAGEIILICALVAGKRALMNIKGRASNITNLVQHFKQITAVGIVSRWRDGIQEYLLHYSQRWKNYYFVGGDLSEEEDNMDTSETLKRELYLELGIPRDHGYKLDKLGTVRLKQFSKDRDELVFKDYEINAYRVFTTDLFQYNGDDENKTHWFSITEICNRRIDNETSKKGESNSHHAEIPISQTVVDVLLDLGLLTTEMMNSMVSDKEPDV